MSSTASKRLVSVPTGSGVSTGVGHASFPPSSPASPSAPVVDMKYLIRALIKYQASDLHLKVGRPPLYRINGRLIPAKMEELDERRVQGILHGLMTEAQRRKLESERQVDFSFREGDLGRFRCNIFFQRGVLSAAIRMVPLTTPSLDDLGIPAVAKDLCQRHRGLLLVTGATGSGKSTTLAGMVQFINESSPLHVLTIEDPIEFLYRDLKATITQREVGSDVATLEQGLVAGLRQDPDVIVIGELRTKEMIQAALTAAETGHLVISTLHTNDAKSTIDRILDVFPGDMRPQVRIQLASGLAGVVSQQLIERADGSGRVVACEILVRSPAIADYILKDEALKIPDAIMNSNNYYKMQSMNQALERLVLAGTITADEALRSSGNPEDLKLRLSGITREQGY